MNSKSLPTELKAYMPTNMAMVATIILCDIGAEGRTPLILIKICLMFVWVELGGLSRTVREELRNGYFYVAALIYM